MVGGHNILYQAAETNTLSIVDPGNAGTIAVDRNGGECSIVTGGAETRRIGSPERAGIMLHLSLKSDGGNATVTGKGSETFNSGGTEHTTITMDTAGDAISLVSIAHGSGFQWSVLASNGNSLS